MDRVVYAIILVLSPAILYGVALVVTPLIMAYYRGLCPVCGQRGLRCVNWIRGIEVVEGRRVNAAASFYVCERCGLAHKLRLDNKWESVSEFEREHFVKGY